MQKYIIVITALILSITLTLPAQQSKIKGNVKSADDNKPLSSTTLILRKASDSSVVSGAFSDKQGNFTFTTNPGNYFLEVKFVGYETTYIRDIELKKSQTLSLPQVFLSPSDFLLNEVIIEEEKEAVIIGIDSKTFNVTKDILAGGTNVLDVLRNIPSVSVDLDDNITMNGTTPKILIDGRESQLASKDMLKILSSDLVESVELITNPSAKYESEGVSGIIDIKLKKDADNGFNGMVRVSSGDDFNFKYVKNRGLGFNGNYKYKKFNFYASANYGRWSGYGDWFGERKT